MLILIPPPKSGYQISYVKRKPEIGKVWLSVESGEGGEFDLKAYEEAPDKTKFFWENF